MYHSHHIVVGRMQPGDKANRRSNREEEEQAKELYADIQNHIAKIYVYADANIDQS